MAKKVKLDILEIEPQQVTQAEIVTDHEPQVNETDPSPTGLWRRFSKIILIGSFLFLIVSIGITVWYQLGKKTDKPEVVAPSRAVVHSENLLHFQNFAVDFRDDHGSYKVLLCDVVVELNAGAKLSRDTIDIRKAIYKTLHAMSIENLTAARGKKAIKKDLEMELDQIMGGKIVKQVYFTRFTLM